MADNRIAISLPVDGRWVRFVQESLNRYSEMVGFSARLEEMCSSSVTEACEELVRKAQQAGISDPIDLSLDYKGETIVVDIAYNARIPLNPHKTGEYEIPDTSTDLENLDTDSLWLHMIKRRMDRVRFKVQGSRHILRMVKYRRDEGKEKQAWVMAIRPELRKGVILHLDESGGEHPISTLQSPGAGALKLGPTETFIVRGMDGKTSFHSLYMAHIDALGLTSPDKLARLYEQLEAAGMLATAEDNVVNSRFRLLLRKILSPDLSIPNADGVVAAVHRRTDFLFSPLGLGALLAIGLSGVVPFMTHHARFMVGIGTLEDTLLSQPLLGLPLYALMLFQVALHELGHGVVCKHYGGHVPRLGIMFYLGSFIFYCDTTAAWNFQEKWQRVLVSLGGPIVSFVLLGMGLWAAGYFASTGSILEHVFLAFCLFSFFGLAMNFNPFIKMDAYYMLLDYTGIPNLRERSFRFLERKMLGWLGFGSEEDTLATFEERRVFWWYGVLGALVTLVFVTLPLIILHSRLTAHSASKGWILLSAIGCALLVVRLGNLAYGKIKSIRHREYKIQ